MKQVVFNEYNIRMEKSAYLPIASGLLRAYSEAQPDIKENYRFMPFNYHMDSLTNIMARYDEPEVAAFSLSMWNEQLNIHVAREVKRRWPNCLIVFGGPQVPQHAHDYFRQHPFVDVAVRAEGEEAFAKILARNLESRNFDGLTGVTWRKGDDIVRNTAESHQPKDLDMYPSPYLEGLFDDIMATSGMEMQAIIETNRGCPFPCSFCYWGQGGLSRKYRFHGIERVKKEIEWSAKNKIKYLFNADSNFGMHKRDEEIAEILVQTKKEFGFPEKFRTCFGKNADERIYEIAKKLHASDMEKGITLALQSNTPEVLKNIQRQNIKMSAYQNLQVKFNEVNVPVYSELILGLPGETVESWKTGIENLLKAGLKNQLFIYLCQVFPNTEMWDKDYQARFGIVTRRIELNEIHGAIRSKDLTPEYEDIIVTTNAMTIDEWQDMVLFSWLTMVMHSLKVGFFVMSWLYNRHGKSYADFISFLAQANTPIMGEVKWEMRRQIMRILCGEGRGRFVEGYAPIYWDEEEATFLKLSEKWDDFYDELHGLVREFLKNDAYDYQELVEVMRYQRMKMPSFGGHDYDMSPFSKNIPEYFDMLLTSQKVDVQDIPNLFSVRRNQFADAATFAKETIMWGRKSGTILNKSEWVDA